MEYRIKRILADICILFKFKNFKIVITKDQNNF